MRRAVGLLGFVVVILSVVPAEADTISPYVLVSGYYSSNVLKYDAVTGAPLGTLIPTGSGGLYRPEGLAIGPDGNLLVSSAHSHNVKKYDLSTGAFLGDFAAGSGLQYPRGITFGPDANLYVASGDQSVKRFNGETGVFMDEFVPQGTPYFGRPTGLIFHGNYFYATIGDSHCITRHDATTGALLGVFASGSGLDGPEGLTFGADANLYTADATQDVVRRYDGQSGQFIDDFVPAGSGGLDGPQDVLLNMDGSLLVTSFENSSVLRYDGTTGAFLGVFASGGDLSAPTFMLLVPEPSALAALSLGCLIVIRRR
jgi:DNA-binding beta-propeller fold protein YncE